MSWRLEDMSCRRLEDTSWSRFEDVIETSKMFTGNIFNKSKSVSDKSTSHISISENQGESKMH